MSAVQLERAHLPSSLVDLARRYVDLCNQLADTIESLYDSLDSVDRMLAVNDLQGAGRGLEASRGLLAQARDSLSALEKATVEVFTMLRRAGAGGTSAQLEQARQSLDAALARLEQLALDYERRLAEAEAAAAGKRVLLQPSLTARLDRDAAWVGENVVLSGVLAAGNTPLVGREVAVLLDGVEIARAQTGSQGRYSCVVSVPFEYVPRRMVQASFVPSGGDLAGYRPALSGEYVLTVRFHQSLLDVELVGRLHPGLPVSVAGMVESSGAVSEREVLVEWEGETVGSTVSGLTGWFECIVMLPEQTPDGAGTLRMQVESVDEALTAPAMQEISVDIDRVAPVLDLHVVPVVLVPSMALSLPRQLLGGGFVRMVTVSGEVKSSLPMEVPSMTAYWGERQVRWQQQGVAFEQMVPLDVSVWSMGVRTLTVRAVAREPWHRPAESHVRLLVVNLFIPFVWLSALALALLFGLAVRRRFSANAPLPASVPGVGWAGFDGGYELTTGGSAGGEDAGPRRSMLSLYFNAVNLLRATIGVALRREMTLREYLSAAAERMPVASRLFGRLTSLTERALYGRGEPARRDLSLGRRLLAALAAAYRPKRREGDE